MQKRNPWSRCEVRPQKAKAKGKPEPRGRIYVNAPAPCTGRDGRSGQPSERECGYLACPECGGKDWVYVGEYRIGPYTVIEERHCQRCGAVLQLERPEAEEGW